MTPGRVAALFQAGRDGTNEEPLSDTEATLGSKAKRGHTQQTCRGPEPGLDGGQTPSAHPQKSRSLDQQRQRLKRKWRALKPEQTRAQGGVKSEHNQSLRASSGVKWGPTDSTFSH